MKKIGIGVDVGATQVRICVGDEGGKLLWRGSKKTSFPDSVDDYVAELVEAIRAAAGRCPPNMKVEGIGIASAGPIDVGRGGMSRPANIPYEFVPLVAPIARALDLRVVLMNDANAAALGEKTYGAGVPHDNLLYVTISSGIGGGAIVDGHLLSGKDGNAAEIGHVVVDPAGQLECGCGHRGHWEAYCSGRSIPRFVELLAKNEGETGGAGGVRELLKITEATSPAILAAASRGGAFGNKVIRELGRLNAMGVANAVNMFDPSVVTVGGGVALKNEGAILGPIKEMVGEFCVNRVPEIMLTPLGDDAGLLGALALVLGAPDRH